MKKLNFLILVACLILFAGYQGKVLANEQDLIVLCYHDIPKNVNLDDYGVDQRTFIDTIEYFRRHGYSFVSLQDIISAHDPCTMFIHEKYIGVTWEPR